jgi:hypothetical protein
MASSSFLVLVLYVLFISCLSFVSCTNRPYQHLTNAFAVSSPQGAYYDPSRDRIMIASGSARFGPIGVTSINTTTPQTYIREFEVIVKPVALSVYPNGELAIICCNNDPGRMFVKYSGTGSFIDRLYNNIALNTKSIIIDAAGQYAYYTDGTCIVYRYMIGDTSGSSTFFVQNCTLLSGATGLTFGPGKSYILL